jgi:hypothetical protein
MSKGLVSPFSANTPPKVDLEGTNEAQAPKLKARIQMIDFNKEDNGIREASCVVRSEWLY